MGNIGSGPASGENIPEEMKAVMLTKHVAEHSSDASAYDGCFEVQTIPVPKPRSGQVLVRVERSPCNPSDLSMMTGTYNAAQREELPCQVGFEASGVVVASGGGYGYTLLGKRVAIVSKGGGRMWAEYAVASALESIVINDDTTFDQASSSFVNPLTAISFLEHVDAGKHKGLVLTACASALCKMTIKLAREQKKELAIIGVVRKRSQVDDLLATGATAVVVSTEDGWKKQLADLCAEHSATIAFDAVAGELTGQVLHAMPKSSVMHVYGGLSLESCGSIVPSDLIFADKTVKGFWLTAYIKTKGKLGLASWMRTVKNNLTGPLETVVRESFTMDRAGEAVASYVGNMAGGKITIAPRGLGDADDADAETDETKKAEE